MCWYQKLLQQTVVVSKRVSYRCKFLVSLTLDSTFIGIGAQGKLVNHC